MEAAQKLLAGLSDEMRSKATFSFDDPNRLYWHFYPVASTPRKGAVLKTMTSKEKELVKELLRTGTSKPGYETALNMYDWVANGKEPEKLILTAGQVALRDNYETVRKDLGIE